MDRLEELIKKYGPHSCSIYDLRNVDGDIEWLISENEQLKKEKKWLLRKVAKELARTGYMTQKDYRQILVDEMQQALKEK